MKLDLASGQYPADGFEGVDLWSGARHVVDLMKFPWPWADESVDEARCSHFVEHLPAREVEERDLLRDAAGRMLTRFLGKDFFFAFFDECYRILKPGARMRVVVPAQSFDGAYWDPTHRRFLAAETFYYLSREWRQKQKLDHYPVDYDFAVEVAPYVDEKFRDLQIEQLHARIHHARNVVLEHRVTLTKRVSK